MDAFCHVTHVLLAMASVDSEADPMYGIDAKYFNTGIIFMEVA